MNNVILHRVPADITPLAAWLGKEVGKRTTLIVPRELVPQYEGWPKRIIGLDRYETNPLAEYTTLELARSEPVARVVGLSEYDLLRTARLRARLRLPGQSVESATAFRDKLVMKTLIRAAGIAAAPFRALQSGLDVFDFVAEVGFPVVVKPRAGAGSADTHVLRDAADLERWFAGGPELDGGTLIERFVEGDMYHVDGLIADGWRSMITASRYHVGCLAFLEGRSLVSAQLPPDGAMHHRLVAFAHAVLGALPTPDMAAFHLEVFHTRRDELIFCEVASRIGGGRINDVFALRFGINPVEYLFRRETGGTEPLPTVADKGRLFGWALVPPREGVLLECTPPRPRPGLADFKLHCQSGQSLRAATLSVSAMASLIGEGDTEDEVAAALARAVAEFEESCRWQIPAAEPEQPPVRMSA